MDIIYVMAVYYSTIIMVADNACLCACMQQTVYKNAPAKKVPVLGVHVAMKVHKSHSPAHTHTESHHSPLLSLVCLQKDQISLLSL